MDSAGARNIDLTLRVFYIESASKKLKYNLRESLLNTQKVYNFGI